MPGDAGFGLGPEDIFGGEDFLVPQPVRNQLLRSANGRGKFRLVIVELREGSLEGCGAPGRNFYKIAVEYATGVL